MSLAIVALTSNAALGQTVNPGAVEQEMQRQQQRMEQQAAPPKQQGPGVVGPKPGSKIEFPGGGPTVVLKSVTFDHSEFISEKELNAIAAKYIGKKVDFAALQRLVKEIDDIYTARGIVTGNASLPPQKLDGGRLHVRLVEGKAGNVTVGGTAQTLPRYITAAIPVPPGKVIDVPKLNRDVNWFNRVNDVQVRALLQPGAEFGLTDVQLAVTEPPRNTLQIFHDNQSVPTIGRYEEGVFYKRHGLLGIDDRLTLYGTYSEGDLAGNASYNIPIGSLGGRLGASYNRGQIKIVDGPLSGLNDTGWSQTVAVNESQPLYIDEHWTWLANAAESYGTVASDLSDVKVTDGRTTKWTGGTTLAYIGKDISLSASPNISPTFTRNVISDNDLNFINYNGTTTNSARLPAGFSVVAAGAWQYATARLLPSDQLFQIGGPTTVRGYPSNVLAGDSGYYGNFELHKGLSDHLTGLDLYAFSDIGRVYSTFPGNKAALSYGTGFSWTPRPWVTFEGSVGFSTTVIVSGQSRHEMYYRITLRPPV
jgi:hemolysin activation/secretion protein